MVMMACCAGLMMPGLPILFVMHDIFMAAGDSYMIYPGAESSIRFEKMREGIVDYEKIKYLKQKQLDQQHQQ
jgi:hypothetical protein